MKKPTPNGGSMVTTPTPSPTQSQASTSPSDIKSKILDFINTWGTLIAWVLFALGLMFFFDFFFGLGQVSGSVCFVISVVIIAIKRGVSNAWIIILTSIALTGYYILIQVGVINVDDWIKKKEKSGIVGAAYYTAKELAFGPTPTPTPRLASPPRNVGWNSLIVGPKEIFTANVYSGDVVYFKSPKTFKTKYYPSGKEYFNNATDVGETRFFPVHDCPSGGGKIYMFSIDESTFQVDFQIKRKR